ncbi:MAG: hypothetical protein Solivirus1_5 [Solivirus sp.]|uniref:Uncharacterized protein n=1 Tax=Solivirus sp. TaxID=2487772 RepID=A0A3G5AFD7_9VIRU|nr:MAG: hypothetical protein Solivirus1_5 [Solivirus sp.]
MENVACLIKEYRNNLATLDEKIQSFERQRREQIEEFKDDQEFIQVLKRKFGEVISDHKEARRLILSEQKC